MSRPVGSRNRSPRRDRRVVRRSLIDFPSPTPQSTACRLWQGRVPPHGYGERWDPARQEMVLVHRWVYETINGPTELHVLHRCDQPLCYRYAHLFAGTPADNAADRAAKGRTRGQFVAGAVPNAKLTAADAEAIRARVAAGESMRALGREYGVHGTTISAIRDGKNWKAL